MFLVLVTLSCIIRHSYSYNLDTELPIIRKGDKGSYFGFSVATHSFFDDLKYLNTSSKNYTWLLVGAPKGNRLLQSQDGFYNPGVVMRCDFKNDSDCSALPFQNRGVLKNVILNRIFFYKERMLMRMKFSIKEYHRSKI
ncbi:integrin alpha-V-like isoform X1 [Acropora millepora]|uniref:integrin alpha-V-like isoform X1 n=1 Tax=Acropora millepora TaxID=45264 RepID=UPI001CF11275|nr:integrin alpha-V-like isoform X1 [Acropora millepora]